ncbi:hypothetical protein [Lactococcus lactis]|uniref:DUF4352 domain-containing protein n=1 Tax=Lactococcus lactis TaxID=1358 RepID=A0A3S3M3S2_9LACT|nr:hypothetical protein [Lactococcus lactis]NYZ59811.1 hypothetical protein [Lactococcus lactis]RWR44384.1 hypothetical protein EO246_11830 [Lactococcus lactis]
MNHKKVISMIVIALILCSSVFLIFRYQVVNKNKDNLYGVHEEVFIHENQLIHASNVDFKIKRAQVVRKQSGIKVFINLELQKTGVTNFGFKKNNSNFFENMDVATTDFSFSMNPTIESIYNLKINKTFDNFKQGKLTTPQIEFDIPKTLLESSNNKLKFRFLVPKGKTNSYIKYSLLLK